MSHSPDQLPDQSTDSLGRVARTYGRTNGDEMVTLGDSGCESNARESENHAIGILELGRSLRFAEVNGAKVIAAADLPESILHAMASLLDAISREVSDARDRERQADADRPRAMCRWHLGQIADSCSPCRSEELEAYRRFDDEHEPNSTPEGRRRARAIYEQTRRNRGDAIAAPEEESA